MRERTTLSKLVVVLAFALCWVALRAPQPAYAATITVNTTADEFDAVPNATCSLREAIQSVNTGADFGGCTIVGSGGVTINLPVGTFTLTRNGANENLNATGDLDVTSDITLVGAGATQTRINAASLSPRDRVIHVVSGNLTLQDLTITGGGVGNNASGAGVLNQGTSLTIENSIVHTNDKTGSPGFGGGIAHESGTLTIRNSTIRNNSSFPRGGGVSVINTTTATNIENSTFNNNSCFDGGGAIYTEGPVSISNVTFTANNCNPGGAIRTFGALAVVTINNSTFYANVSLNGYAIRATDSSSVTVRNTIFTGHAGNNCTVASGGVVTGFDLRSNDNTCGTPANAVTNFDTVLRENGGPTFTHSLLPGSNAIDTGNNTTCAVTDQRGEGRPVDYDLNGTATCDIGAFERQADETFTATVGDAATVTFGATLVTIVDNNSGTNPGNVTVTRHNQPPGGGTPDAGEMPFHVNIDAATSTGLDINLTLCYTDWELTHNTTGVVENDLTLYRWNSALSVWEDQGVDTLDTTNNCATKNNVTDLSSWTLSSGPLAPTAVSLITFQAGSTPLALISIGTLLVLLLLTVGLLRRRAPSA